MRQRLLYLTKVYLTTVLIFIVAKWVFMFANRSGHDFAAADALSVVRHGLSLDLSTSLYLLILPFLVVLISIFLERPWLKRILRIYYAIVAVALMLAFVADTSLYPFWGFKLDASCLQYLASPDEARASVSGLYLAVRIAVFIVGAAVLWWIFCHIPLWKKKPSNPLVASLVSLLLIPVFIIGIRGGLDESTTNIGQVYYSQNQFLNHSAVNPVFSFLSSFEKTASEIVEYDFMDDAACQTLLSGVFPTESVLTDTLLRTNRPNVVIILLESCSNVFAPVMPQLNRLKSEGIWFSNCFGNTYRTDRGTVSTLSGYPAFPTMSVMKMPKKAAQLPSIAKSLQQEGYQTSYLYGGDINFTNMRSYLIATGWERLHWKADYTSEEQNSAKWGVRDDITFKTLYHQILAADPSKPFLMGFSTLSSHEPWDVPVKKLADEVQNAFHYLDQCIGQFVSDLKTTPQWDNLLIVLLPDHGINFRDIDETHPERNHIPMLWLGGAVREPKVVGQFCNQTDFAATLLGQMNLRHDDFTFSRDVLSKNYQKPFGFHCFNNGFSVVDSTGFTVFDLTADKIIAGSNNNDAVRLGKAILQTSSEDLKEKK
ncbi:MAG: LTA synthase family protein [Prevotella sp.]|nr:LTA synthase family protein [Prevotella sp.]